MLGAGGEAGAALLGGEQVGLQGGAGDRGPGAGCGVWLGFGGVDLFEQLAVAVEEGAVDSGGAGDAADADLFAVARRVAQRGEDALAASVRVGLPSLGHGRGSAAGGSWGGAHVVGSGWRSGTG